MLYDIFEAIFIQFPFQLLVSEAVFLTDSPKRAHFLPRLLTGFVIQICLSALWNAVLTPYVSTSLIFYTLLYLGFAFLLLSLSGAALIWNSVSLSLSWQADMPRNI